MDATGAVGGVARVVMHVMSHRRVHARQAGNGLAHVGQHRRRHQVGAAQGRDAQVGVGLGANGIVDLGDGLPGTECLEPELRRHDVAVVALRHGQEHVRTLRAGASQDILVRPVAAEGGPAERGRQAVERRRRQVHDEDVPAGTVQLVGDARHRPGRSRRSRLSWLLLGHRLSDDPRPRRGVPQDVRDGAAHGEVAAEPRAGTAGPQMIMSAPRSIASSTIAAPTSRAWSRTVSSL